MIHFYTNTNGISEETLDLLAECFKDDWYYNGAGYTFEDRIKDCKHLLPEVKMYDDNRLIGALVFCFYTPELGSMLLDDGIYPEVKEECDKYYKDGEDSLIYLTNIFIHKDYRGKRLSRKLFNYFQKDYIGKMLIVDADNPITLKIMNNYKILKQLEHNYWIVGGLIEEEFCNQEKADF